MGNERAEENERNEATGKMKERGRTSETKSG
jgi:hypothetical protein